jgi:uncharacterized protein YqeY
MAALPERLRADLMVARKARDAAAVTALRTTLAAIENAEAPPLLPGPALGVVGPQEHDRLILSASDHDRILREEIDVRTRAAEEYEAIGQADAAAIVRAELAVLQTYLG